MADSSPAPDGTTVELRAGALRLAVRTDLGGSIAGFWHGDTPVLRSVEPDALPDSHAAGSFPLVPYSNRIAYRRFRWKGRDYTTEPNFPGPHSIHGIGWQRAWRVTAQTASSLVLAMSHRPDADWPFAFDAEQRLELAADGLTLHLAMTNTGEIDQPAGLGWHPYFPKRARSRLHVDLSHRWDNDPTLLPVRKVAQPGIDSDIAHLDCDNCFEGWPGVARIRDEKLKLRITSAQPYLVVYCRPEKDMFCVEPVSQVNNAIHMADPAAHGLRSLAPGERFEVQMRIEVEPV